eukprot:4896910-Amphidinium_carterae.1
MLEVSQPPKLQQGLQWEVLKASLAKELSQSCICCSFGSNNHAPSYARVCSSNDHGSDACGGVSLGRCRQNGKWRIVRPSRTA